MNIDHLIEQTLYKYFCLNDKCPICSRQMKRHTYDCHSCFNGCISFDDYFYDLTNTGQSDSWSEALIFVFKEQYYQHKNNKEEIKQVLQERINYWKENDRYLSEILSR